MKKEDIQLRETIRKRLVQCRTDNGLTQAEVGKVVGKSKNAVASWEQGLSLPDIVTLYQLSVYYEKPLEFMYGKDD